MPYTQEELELLEFYLQQPKCTLSQLSYCSPIEIFPLFFFGTVSIAILAFSILAFIKILRSKNHATNSTTTTL